MGEEIRKLSLTVDELLFYEYGGRAPFFRRDQKLQRYCLVIQNLDNRRDLTNLYNGFVNGVFPRTGQINPTWFDIFEPGVCLTKRMLDLLERKKRFVFINAPKGIDTTRVSNRTYVMNMGEIDLKPEYPKSTYISHRQAFL